MVILQFNKLIRNKWVWGVFAVGVCLAFGFSDLLSDRKNAKAQAGKTVGTFGSEADGIVKISAADYDRALSELRSEARNSDITDEQLAEDAWKRVAAIETAEENGIKLPVPKGMSQGEVDRVEMNALYQSLVSADALVSPMEVEQLIRDMTDKVEVKLVKFTQSKEEADAIAPRDEAGLKAWYDENSKSLALPDLVQVAYVKYAADDAAVEKAKALVTDDDIGDYYDTNKKKLYTSTDTNGVETVKTLDEVKESIIPVLAREAAVECFATNLQQRVYSSDAGAAAERLAKIAGADGKNIETSGFFALDGSDLKGFTVRMSSVFPGAEDVASKLADTDEDNPFGVVSSDNAAWLFQVVARKDAYTPSFDEAKTKIVERVQNEDRAAALKAKADAVREKGKDALLAEKDVSEAYTVTGYNGLKGVANSRAVYAAAHNLKTGAYSEFIPNGVNAKAGVVVVCTSREPGDAQERISMRNQAQQISMSIARGQFSYVASKWPEWNLAQLNFQKVVEQDADAEDSVEDAE